ncbi:MAG TPA: hypothetical protein VIX84_00150, partial [Acidimicrobiales bacterium]
MTEPLPDGYAVEWAIGLRGALAAEVHLRFPELLHRWPLVRAGYRYDNYILDDQRIVLVLHDDPEPVVLAGPGQPKPLPFEERPPEGMPPWLVTQWLGERLEVPDSSVVLTVDRRWPVPRWLDNATFGTIGADWASQLMLAVTRGMSFLAANPEAPPEPAKPVPPITSRFYKPHPSFPQPAEIDSPLWRYLTVGKFVDLIWRHELWFSRLDRLGDPLEGSLGVPNALRQATDPVVQRNQLQLGSEQMRSHLFVSCWHLSTHESAAMWAGYTHEQEAVAVRSTFRRLVESIEGSDEFFAGEIAYGDHRQT